ncbi:MAG TPA: hypothetical protein VMU89_05180 [Thermomicrobiaceae bacterium]|nr:hypothetical protein [Thermomicrobiaceae bacterium]
MSRLELLRGQENTYNLPVHLPFVVVDWDLTSIDFRVRPRGSADTPDEIGDLLVKSTRTPPGGVTLLDDDLVRVVLSALDTRQLAGADAYDYSLEFRPGSFNVYVVDFGLLAARDTTTPVDEEPLLPRESDEPPVG